MTGTTPAHVHQLGEESSIWFKLTPLLKGDPDNPMRTLMQMAERYGGVIPVNMANQRVVLLTEPEHFKHVLVAKADNYIKYFDGLRPIFGKSMITVDGQLWQKIRAPQQPAFHPDMFAEYIPYFLAAIRSKLEHWRGDAARKRVKYSYLPFGAGKRSCIGGAMSQVENTLALSILLRRFRPEYVGPEPPGINATVTLTPKGGLPFKIREL